MLSKSPPSRISSFLLVQRGLNLASNSSVKGSYHDGSGIASVRHRILEVVNLKQNVSWLPILSCCTEHHYQLAIAKYFCGSDHCHHHFTLLLFISAVHTFFLRQLRLAKWSSHPSIFQSYWKSSSQFQAQRLLPTTPRIFHSSAGFLSSSFLSTWWREFLPVPSLGFCRMHLGVSGRFV